MTVVQRVADEVATALGNGWTVQHRHNHAGTGKLSFLVKDPGQRAFWAKVAADDEGESQVQTWASVAGLLAERHAAPPVLDVLTVDGRTTLLFPFLDARVATAATLSARFAEVDAILAGLHADTELATLLGPPTTTAESFRNLWLERFVGDLEILDGRIDGDLHDYLTAQVRDFETLIAGLDDVAHAPVHGDPWHENVLLAPDRVWLLDWEDLAVGDPAIDRAILRGDCFGPDHTHWSTAPADQAARRALLLDAVVDVAADWVENADPQVKAAKHAAWTAGLEVLRSEIG